MSIVKVAQRAGVSQATVSRVVNNDRNVTPETALKVREAMRELGYVPKAPALRRGPRRNQDVHLATGNIAFLAKGEDLKVFAHSPVMHDVVRGIESALAERGLSMIQGAIGGERQIPPIVARRQVDGLIVWPTLFGMAPEVIEALRSYQIVYVMSAAMDSLPGDRVKNNNRSIGRLAAEYLISKGHKVVAHAAMAEMPAAAERWAAFAEAARAQGVEAVQYVIEQRGLDLNDLRNEEVDRSIEAGVAQMLASNPRPTGVFATCDALVARMYPALKNQGVKIGTEMEVISCNNEFALLAGLDPCPKSIDIRGELIGRRAVEQLLWRISNPGDETCVTVEIDPLF
ncbi:TPA: hypothetical protein DDW35_13110 [Candidatus Sumerlaeota bacterium]|jgi:DNA-binding LacI/PurR family transcriptional regulator|nr:hypothetical protein [Candidatus Sumerlaeota bacterium]